MTWRALVALAAAGLQLAARAAQAATCTNLDYQVEVLRYTATNCGGTETVSTYQSAAVVREGTNTVYSFTCCDDQTQVSIYDGTTTTTVNANQCNNGLITDITSVTASDVRAVLLFGFVRVGV